MLAERETGISQSVDPPGTVRVVLASDLDSVRIGLQDLFACDLMTRLSEESRGAVEIVLAEVLNNVVEHAYAAFPGKIEICVTRRETYLFIRMVDWGLPMPDGELPVGRMTDPKITKDLPEGGFGWFLIRNLSQDLTYDRDVDKNILGFCITVDDQE